MGGRCRGRGKANDIGQLSFGDEILGFGSDEFLFEGDDFGALRLLVFQLLDLIRHFGFVVTTRLHRALRVANLLQHRSIIFQVFRKRSLLFANLGHQDAQLVGYVRHRIVPCRLTPVRQLRGDGDALAAGGFVGADGVVLAFDDFEDFLAQFGLLDAAQGCHGEAMLWRALLRASSR